MPVSRDNVEPLRATAVFACNGWMGADLPDDAKAYLVLAVSSLVTGAVRALRNWIKIRRKKA